MTLHFRWFASKCGATGDECRTTITSTPIASMFLAVSMNDSPLLMLDVPAVKSCVSELRRLADSVKLVRVRVEGSKNRLTITLPFRSVRFVRLALVELLGRVEDDLDFLTRQVFEVKQMATSPLTFGEVRTHD